MRLRKDLAKLSPNNEQQTKIFSGAKSGTTSPPAPISGSREYHALMQVSKQIRQEFRPMYLAASTALVGAEDVMKYLSDFYPPVPGTDRTAKHIVPGNITILCTKYDASFVIRWLKQAFQYPNITFRAHNVDTDAPMRAANLLLASCSTNQTFGSFLQDGIDVVYAKEARGRLAVEFYLNEEHVEELQFVDAYPTAEKWLEEMGLRELLQGYKVVLFVAESTIT